MKPVLSLFAVVVLTGACASAEPDPHRPFLGTWEYRQAAGHDFDLEGERIVVSSNDGSMNGLYFGLEREGEHGLYYSLVELSNLKVTTGGEIFFTVPGREFYYTRPTRLEEVGGKQLPSAGFTRDELSMRGRLVDGKLILTCASVRVSCPDDVMVFLKGSWKPK